MSDVTRLVRVYAGDADWLWRERVPRENMAEAFARIRLELEGLRENEVKERFRE